MGPMASQHGTYESYPPESFVVEVFSEIGEEIVQRRWREVNVVLRLSMLSGLEMQLDATLNMLCDFASEIARYDRTVVYFWDEADQQVQARVTRNMDDVPADAY